MFSVCYDGAGTESFTVLFLQLGGMVVAGVNPMVFGIGLFREKERGVLGEAAMLFFALCVGVIAAWAIFALTTEGWVYNLCAVKAVKMSLFWFFAGLGAYGGWRVLAAAMEESLEAEDEEAARESA